MTVKSITAAIADVNIPSDAAQFSPTRYPYTYACDYLRNHPEIVPDEVWANPNTVGSRMAAVMSRADASRVRHIWAGMLGIADLEAAIELANAYLAEHRVQVSNADLDEALTQAVAR